MNPQAVYFLKHDTPEVALLRKIVPFWPKKYQRELAEWILPRFEYAKRKVCYEPD